MMTRPGGAVTKRPLHFIWITDCSGSMEGNKIESLNRAIREAVPHMISIAEENPHAEIFVRAIKFSNGATWHVSTPTEVHSFKWMDLKASGLTDMGKALKMVAEQLDPAIIGNRGLPPVLVLISDGQPTDDFGTGLKLLESTPWGKKAVRLSIAIGSDADIATLHKFMGNHSEMKPLEAKNAEDLVSFIKWASTVPIQASSSPKTKIGHEPAASPMPQPAMSSSKSADDDDVW